VVNTLDEPLLTITALARQAGAHPSSAENYVKSGQLTPVRASNGIRLFRPSDVARLRKLVADGVARRGRQKSSCATSPA